jgi:hypothetical protein
MLRMRSRNVHRGNAAVRRPRDVKLAAGDPVIGADHVEELGKDPLAALKEQFAVRRRGRHDEVTAAFGFGAEVALERTVHRVHRLRAAAHDDHGGIGPRRIVTVGQGDFVVNRRPATRPTRSTTSAVAVCTPSAAISGRASAVRRTHWSWYTRAHMRSPRLSWRSPPRP